MKLKYKLSSTKLEDTDNRNHNKWEGAENGVKIRQEDTWREGLQLHICH